MYFALTLAAAIIATILWVKNERRSELKLGALCLIYWGAAIMWAVDLVIAWGEEGAEAFETGASATMLGVVVVALGAAIWAVILGMSKRKIAAR